MNARLLLFDLDGTLLRSDKTISPRTLEVLRRCRNQGILDMIDYHYWNFKDDPKKQDQSWGDSIYTDFADFDKPSFKMCVEIFDDAQAAQLQEALPDCDCIRFSDGYWYKFTGKTATKENAILKLRAVCGIGPEEIAAFGDDYADIGMLELCGTGIAMDNAIDAVKERADKVIGSNDEDGIADYLESYLNDTESRRTGPR